MRIITAMDSFKGCLSSNELNEIIEQRVKAEINEAEVFKIPISDGGEGFIDSLFHTGEYDKKKVIVSAPLGNKIEAEYLMTRDGKIAVIESAKAIGLDLVEHLDPLRASSYGLGELINDAVAKGAVEVNVSLGGSATNEAGIGLLKALDFVFYNADDELLDVGLHNLHEVGKIKAGAQFDIAGVSFNAITDVKNVFTGETGATRVFGEQKGLDGKESYYADSQLDTFRKFIKKSYGTDLNEIEGTGAAGGISGIMSVFLNSKIIHGIDYVLEAVEFNSACENADYIITGEGRIDEQTFYGKVIQGIVDRAAIYDVPVIAIGGSVKHEKIPQDSNIPPIFSILNSVIPLEEAMDPKVTKNNLDFTIRNICHLIRHTGSVK